MPLREALPAPDDRMLYIPLFQNPDNDFRFAGLFEAVGDRDRRAGERRLWHHC
jgi:hypothetical protein